MSAPNLNAIEARAFVPSGDFEQSKRFYQAIGFTMEWANADMASFRSGPAGFLLQKFYVPDHANNFVMSLLVEDVDALVGARLRRRERIRTDGRETRRPPVGVARLSADRSERRVVAHRPTSREVIQLSIRKTSRTSVRSPWTLRRPWRIPDFSRRAVV